MALVYAESDTQGSQMQKSIHIKNIEVLQNLDIITEHYLCSNYAKAN
jgi:hypothetical protein